jgi:transcriptional regulator with XRE-family HTH domain
VSAANGRRNTGRRDGTNTDLSSIRPEIAPTRSSVLSTPGRAELGAAIKNAYANKLTQAELARRLGVAQNTVSRWSTGDVEPSLADIYRIEQICGVTRGHILRAAGYVAEALHPEDVIDLDVRLDPARRELLLSAYRAALQQNNRITF